MESLIVSHTHYGRLPTHKMEDDPDWRHPLFEPVYNPPAFPIIIITGDSRATITDLKRTHGLIKKQLSNNRFELSDGRKLHIIRASQRDVYGYQFAMKQIRGNYYSEVIEEFSPDLRVVNFALSRLTTDEGIY